VKVLIGLLILSLGLVSGFGVTKIPTNIATKRLLTNLKVEIAEVDR
jgi:hypothetical protein